MKKLLTVVITPDAVLLDGQRLPVTTTDDQGNTIQPTGAALLSALYKNHIGGYPKFYKMDPLARLGFVASELLLEREAATMGAKRFEEREDRAIVLINRSASLAADSDYETTIQPGEDYFPSPADFVYTLPNIVTGEIAIRNKYFGESNFLCIAEKDDSQIERLIATALADAMTGSVLGGWLECTSANDFVAELSIWEKEK